MPDYDFHQLSPHDLEILTRDLLQANWGVTLESFKTGRDGGIDLRYASGPDRTIVQVKHFQKAGLRALLRNLSAEASKVRRLRPDRYVLVTSVGLTPHNKDQIVAAIGPDLVGPSDVLGAEDLNNLLGQHPEIEGRHFKLWLASRGVLDRVLANAEVTRSEFKARKVHEQAKRYVAGSAFPMARRMLESERIVIVAGPPGVGKTTLADLLLYEHLERGFQAVLIQKDVTEGERLFQAGTRQVFYFDDFMGATFAGDSLGRAGGVDDRALLAFVSMVRETPTARLILTTREHVYAQATGKSERLRDAGLGSLKVMLNMPSYSMLDRAKILYNHIYFSDLPSEFRNELLRDDFYKVIVKHQKFNPRLIEWLSNHRRLHAIPVARYRTFIEGLLRNPAEIWRHAYEQEVTEAGRSLLLALRSLGGQAGMRPLRAAFAVLHRTRSERHNFPTRSEDFQSGLREVVDSFVRLGQQRGLEVIDPSVLDLLNFVVASAPDNAVDIVLGAFDFAQVEQVWKLARAQSGRDMIEALGREARSLAPRLGELAMQERRVVLGKGMTGFRGSTYERRLTTILDMAQRLSSKDVAALVEPVMGCLSSPWQEDDLSVDDCVQLLRTLDDISYLPGNEVDGIRMRVSEALMSEMQSGCRADELRDILNAVNVIAPTFRSGQFMASARAGFQKFKEDHFGDDLRDCRSTEHFEGLVEDLELFGEKLGVDVEHLVNRVADAKGEYEDHQEAYADQMHDDWKERAHEVRDAEMDVSDLFGSLRDV